MGYDKSRGVGTRAGSIPAAPHQKSLARALRFGLGSMIRLNPILDGFLE